jgi:DNA-binding NarL/FixJ family response regulator
VNPTPARTAILLDSHPIWLDAVSGVLGRAGVEVVGTATATAAALALVSERRPDLLVTETRLDGELAEGLALIREARLRHPELRVVALAASSLRADVDDTLAAGAVAYVLKTAHPDDLAAAVRQAFSHSVYLAPATSGHPAVETSPAPRRTAEPAAGLTKRELEILRLVAEGHSNAQLAQMLWVTEQTVKFHLSNVYRKLEVSNRTEAARWAQLQGLLESREDGERRAA